MKKSPKLYLKLFTATFGLSAFTFGGGFVIIPLMRKKFVDQLKWIDEQEMLDLTAIAQSSPGAIAVNASILVGYRVAGITGALATVVGTVLPPLIILSVISMFYTAFRDNYIVNLVMKGMQAGVGAVICDVVISLGSTIFQLKRILPPVMMFLTFIAVYFFNINIILIIFICGFIGAMDVLWQKRRKKGVSQ